LYIVSLLALIDGVASRGCETAGVGSLILDTGIEDPNSELMVKGESNPYSCPEERKFPSPRAVKYRSRIL